MKAIISSLILYPFFFIEAQLPSEGNSGQSHAINDTLISSPFSTTPYLIPQLTGSYRFDGILNDECWKNMTPLELVMHIPDFGMQPTEKSEVFICHDNSFVYIAGRFFDSDPDKITVTSKLRDKIDATDDDFIIIFDTFHDHENGMMFQTNASGVRADMTIAKDGTELPPWNNTWNTFWDVKTTIDSLGWYMEMMIPFSSLRFKGTENKVEMGLIFMRYLPRNFELDISPAIKTEWGFWSFVKISQARTIIFEGIRGKKPFYIAPYLTSGLNSESMLNQEETAYRIGNDFKFSGGLDLKYGLTNNLTADITVNTDFAQVEADVAQINLTRFSLFLPEKRLFFQERASNFTFAFDDMNTLFYSRQIGLSDGRVVPILGGMRLVGRLGKWDVGLMDMQTTGLKSKKDENGVPAENFGVIRLRKQVINQNSYVGGILTSRIGENGTYNEVAGVDGIFRIFGNDYLDFKYAQSFDNSYKNKVLSFDASRIWIDWQRRNEEGLGYDFFYSRAGERFEPDMGFEFRENYYMAGSKLKYGLKTGEKSKILNVIITAKGQLWKDNNTNITQSALSGAGVVVDFKSSFGFTADFNNAFEHLADTFYLSNDEIVAYASPGNYNYNFLSVSTHSPYTKINGFELRCDFGEFYDGNQFGVFLFTRFKSGSFLSLEPSYTYNRVKFPGRNQSFTGHIGSLRAIVMISNKISISSLIQYNNVDHGISSNLRFRYNPKEGNDLYIVYNEGRNIELERVTPNLSPLAYRGLLLKYTYTFVL